MEVFDSFSPAISTPTRETLNLSLRRTTTSLIHRWVAAFPSQPLLVGINCLLESQNLKNKDIPEFGSKGRVDCYHMRTCIHPSLQHRHYPLRGTFPGVTRVQLPSVHIRYRGLADSSERRGSSGLGSMFRVVVIRGSDCGLPGPPRTPLLGSGREYR